MLNTVRRWLGEEPVRVWLYGVLESLAGLLVLYGVMDSATVPVVLGVIASVLAVPVVEKARSKVTPVGRLDPAMKAVIEGRVRPVENHVEGRHRNSR